MSTDVGQAPKIETTLEQSCEGQDRTTDKEDNVNLKYIYDITTEVIDQDSSSQNFQEDAVVDFYHQFKVENQGPSPTDKEKVFQVYIPSILLENSPKDAKKIFQFRPDDLTLAPKKCSSKRVGDTCYEVGLKPGLPKGVPITVTLELGFIANKNFINTLDRLDLLKSITKDEFEFQTTLNFEDLEVSTKTIFKESKQTIGLIMFAQKWWPIIVGCLGGVIIFATILYAAYRNKLQDKVRIYNKFE